VFSGLTIANLAMVPLVTYIGHTFHWSLYFIIVAIVGAITILLIHLWLPEMEGKKNGHFTNELHFIKILKVGTSYLLPLLDLEACLLG
jgi:DHA1 family arabinose polymer transporter-like MFS transporter